MAQMTNPLTRMNVRQQIILLFVIMVSPILLLQWYGNTRAELILKRHVTNAYVELNKQNTTLLNRDIDTVNKITTTIIQNPLTQQLVRPCVGRPSQLQASGTREYLQASCRLDSSLGQLDRLDLR